MNLFYMKTDENKIKSSEIVSLFEGWFLSIHDVDETLLKKDHNGNYKNPDMRYAIASFIAGMAYSEKCSFEVKI